jgi:hypothetical protein
MHNIHVDKGIIYDAYPNPFIDRLNIRYGVFRQAKTGLQVFNMKGQLVSELEDSQKASGKYEAAWKPQQKLDNGIYFVVLKINDLQVYYKKVLLQR